MPGPFRTSETHSMGRWPAVLLGLALALSSAPARADDPALRERASEALRRAIAYFRGTVAVEGGYLWRYSEDLSAREGETAATATMAWVQPPGTPSVGLAYLAAYEATGDRSYRDAARETAMALVKGQLRSGGWDYSIEFDPERRRAYDYRVGDPGGRRGTTTLDDNTTQEAVRLLMRVDRALEQKDRAIHEAAEYALGHLVDAQYPNGAWPQRFVAPPDPAKFPVKPASYPETWPREFPKADYRGYYTLNDNSLADMVDVMLEATRIYGEARYKAAAERAGGFLLMAQMPEPQPAWAQQYDVEMHPAWARKFEPPAVTGGESQEAMATLLKLYRETGDERYLRPIPKALDYLRRSRLPDGRLARFYELRTNRPLYFTKDYRLTYDDGDMPTHYAFKTSDRTEAISREYERLRASGPGRPEASGKREPPRPSRDLEGRARAVVEALDERGRWLDQGRLRSAGADRPAGKVLSSATFIRNVGVLARYLEATKP